MTEKVWQHIIQTNRLDNRQIYYFPSTDSTNTQATLLAQKGVPKGSVVLANNQTMGRGRLNRPWISPAGTGLYFSLIWHSNLQPKHIAKITIATGVGLSKAIETITGLTPQLKWPNDLLCEGKKLAGVLTENIGKKQQEHIIIIGIGLNVNSPPDLCSNDLLRKATSLYKLSGQPYDRGLLLETIVAKIEMELQSLEKGEVAQVLSDFQLRDATVGKTMTWVTSARKKVIGTSLGIDKDGLLKVQDNKGTLHQVLSGDITLIEA